MTKLCNTCNETKDLDSFPNRKSALDGKDGWCKECRNAYQREYKKKKPQKASKEARRAVQLKYKYGLTEESLKELWVAQGGQCSGCGTEIDCISNSTTHVDHDHSCCPGVKTCGLCIRGLLCSKCNRVLSIVNDDVEILKGLAGYLQDYEVKRYDQKAQAWV